MRLQFLEAWLISQLYITLSLRLTELRVFSHYNDQPFVLFGEITLIGVQSCGTYKYDVLTVIVSLKTTTGATCGFPRLRKAAYSLTRSSS